MKEERMIRTRDGAQLFLTVWPPEADVRGIVVLAHGFGESAARYEGLCARFAREGFFVYLHDQRGHGRTPGRRGIAPGYDSMLDDVEDVAALAAGEHPGLPLTLYGHSMGGNIALGLLLRRDAARFCCAVVTSPWLKLVREPPRVLVALFGGLARLLPNLSVRTPLGAGKLTHNDNMAEADAKNADLHHNIMGMRLGCGLVRAGRHAIRHGADIKIPLLLLSAGDDKIVSTPAIREMAEAAPEITHVEYPGFYHELHNETGSETVFAEVLGFVEKHIV